MMYSNIGLSFRETLPLSLISFHLTERHRRRNSPAGQQHWIMNTNHEVLEKYSIRILILWISNLSAGNIYIVICLMSQYVNVSTLRRKAHNFGVSSKIRNQLWLSFRPLWIHCYDANRRWNRRYAVPVPPLVGSAPHGDRLNFVSTPFHGPLEFYQRYSYLIRNFFILK